MKIRELTESEIVDFSKREESHFFDNKSKNIGGKKIQKIAVAFANADGGEFIVGLKDAKEEVDPNNRWDGCNIIEELNFVFQSIHETSPQVPHDIEILRKNDGTVAVRVYIEKSERVHRTADINPSTK